MSCAYCGSVIRLGVEHVVPRSRGGLDIQENTVQACRRCNSSKGNRLPSEWREGLPEKVYEIESVALSMHQVLKPRKVRGKAVKKDAVIGVRMTSQQRATLEVLAERNGLGLSTWMLHVGLVIAQKESSDEPQ